MNHNPEWCTLPADHVGPCDFGVGPLGDRRACPHAFGSLPCAVCHDATLPGSLEIQTAQLLRLERLLKRMYFVGLAARVELQVDVRRFPRTTESLKVTVQCRVGRPSLSAPSIRAQDTKLPTHYLTGLDDDEVLNLLRSTVAGFLAAAAGESILVDNGAATRAIKQAARRVVIVGVVHAPDLDEGSTK